MRRILSISILILCSNFLFSQVQIGDDIDGEGPSSGSGKAVSISSDGRRVAIGAGGSGENGINSGQVRIYEEIDGIWTKIGDDIDGEAEDDRSGASIAISSDGRRVAIGATSNDGNGNNSGHVRIYGETAGLWTKIGDDIDGEAENDSSGGAVAMSFDGRRVAIGATSNNGNGSRSGHVRIYEESFETVGVWRKIGEDIDGEAANDQSGTSVSLSSNGKRVAIGSFLNDDNGENTGHVRIYEENGEVWTKVGDDIDGETAYELSGTSVSLSSDGKIVAIGAPSNDILGDDTGQVKIYEEIAGVWTIIGDEINGEAMFNGFGFSVSLSADGSVVAIGGPGYGENETIIGHVRIYENIGGVWTKIGDDIEGEAEIDESGGAVAISADRSSVAIGAKLNNGNGENSGHVRVYDLSSILVSVENIDEVNPLNLFPNPGTHNLTLEVPEEIITSFIISIKNVIGQEVFQKSYQNNDPIELDISGFSSGIYLVEVLSGDDKWVEKIVKE